MSHEERLLILTILQLLAGAALTALARALIPEPDMSVRPFIDRGPPPPPPRMAVLNPKAVVRVKEVVFDHFNGSEVYGRRVGPVVAHRHACPGCGAPRLGSCGYCGAP